jgi:hypothetical protein
MLGPARELLKLVYGQARHAQGEIKWNDCIRGLMPEQLFAQELLNSLFCPFCKALRVLDGVSIGNINRRDP